MSNIINEIKLFAKKCKNSNDIWDRRAEPLISSVMKSLIWLKNNRNLSLNKNVINENLSLENIEKLSKLDYGKNKTTAKSILSYLNSIGGYDSNKSIWRQSNTVYENHGYLQMRFTRFLENL